MPAKNFEIEPLDDTTRRLPDIDGERATAEKVSSLATLLPGARAAAVAEAGTVAIPESFTARSMFATAIERHFAQFGMISLVATGLMSLVRLRMSFHVLRSGNSSDARSPGVVAIWKLGIGVFSSAGPLRYWRCSR